MRIFRDSLVGYDRGMVERRRRQSDKWLEAMWSVVLAAGAIILNLAPNAWLWGACALIGGAAVILSVVRVLNGRDDPRQANTHPDPP